MMRTVHVVLVAGLALLWGLPAVGTAAGLGDGTWVGGGSTAGASSHREAAPAAHRYIVQLADPPLVQYEGGIGRLKATSLAVTGRRHVDVASAAARAYVAHLQAVQDRAIRAVHGIAPEARIDWRYQLTLNGFVAKLTPEQAEGVRRLAGVKAVAVEEFFEPEMDSTVPLLHVPEAWEAAGGVREAGLGARIAIVDTGLDARHPFMSDEGLPPAPAGFPAATLHLRDGTVLHYPNPERFTNNKVIAARSFPSPEMLEGLSPAQALERFSPFGGGHGLHVAGIAAGRQVSATLPTMWSETSTVTLSGIAPMAQVLNYKYDFSLGGEYSQGVNLAASPELIAMLQQMVIDQVDVLNMSEGHITFLIDHPSTHPLAQAFDAAADAEIVVVFSAGNAGAQGPTSLTGAFKYSDKVLAVGNTTSTGSVDIKLDLAGAGRPADSLIAGPRGATPITQSISAPLFLAPDGGCTGSADVAGKVAVVVRFGEGTCDYVTRAQVQKDAGAVAALYTYNDRAHGGASAQALALPAVALGTMGGNEIVAWLRTNPPDARVTIQPGVRRGYHETPDLLAGSSSRGPSIDWTLKPDLSAPGTAIWSSTSTVAADGTVAHSYASSSGTSMSAPHVAGAAALVRSAHDGWTSAQVRSALINTSKRVVSVLATTGERRAELAVEGGAGRLDLAQALDPGAFLDPPKASFGKLVKGEVGRLEVDVASASRTDESWSLAAEALGGDGRVVVAPSDLTLRPGERRTVMLTLDTASLTEDEHWGEITLRRAGRDTVLRLVYYAFVEAPESRKDVLLVDWTQGDTPDYGPFYTQALDAADLRYDVWRIDEDQTITGTVRTHPPFKTQQRYDLVVVNTNMSPLALQDTSVGALGAFHYQNLLLHGGNLLLAGQGPQDWWTFRTNSGAVGMPSQNAGCDLCLSRYFAGFQFDITSTLKGRVPGWEAMEVVLRPHPAADGPFRYGLDISTGAHAKDGAAGNQASFASGGLLGPFDPRYDHPYTEGVFDRVRPWVRPLWTYDDRVVGTYVAGRLHPEAKIRWNAMYWGFGLEGVGQGDESTVDRTRLLGDTFNFLAHNIVPRLKVIRAVTGDTRVRLALPATADVPNIAGATIDWDDGSAEVIDCVEEGCPADELVWRHEYDRPGAYRLSLDYEPVVGAAPIHVESDITVREGPAGQAYLPIGHK